MQVGEVGIHHRARGGEVARLGEQVDVEMGAPARRGGDFAPGCADDPPHKRFGGGIVAGIPDDPAQENAGVLVDVVELLAKGKTRAEQVPANLPLDEQHERRFGFPVGVISRQVICEQFPVFKHRVDRVAEKPGLAAELPHAGAVGLLEFANLELAALRHRLVCKR